MKYNRDACRIVICNPTNTHIINNLVKVGAVLAPGDHELLNTIRNTILQKRGCGNANNPRVLGAVVVYCFCKERGMLFTLSEFERIVGTCTASTITRYCYLYLTRPPRPFLKHHYRVDECKHFSIALVETMEPRHGWPARDVYETACANPRKQKHGRKYRFSVGSGQDYTGKSTWTCLCRGCMIYEKKEDD